MQKQQSRFLQLNLQRIMRHQRKKEKKKHSVKQIRKILIKIFNGKSSCPTSFIRISILFLSVSSIASPIGTVIVNGQEQSLSLTLSTTRMSNLQLSTNHLLFTVFYCSILLHNMKRCMQ